MCRSAAVKSCVIGMRSLRPLRWIPSVTLHTNSAHSSILQIFSSSAVARGSSCVSSSTMGKRDFRMSVKSWSSSMPSVDLGVGRGCGALEEVEIAAFVGLPDVLGEERAVAALEAPAGRLPGALALHHLGVVDEQLQPAALDVELDHVALLDESEWSSDERFRSDVQHAAAEGGATHAR